MYTNELLIATDEAAIANPCGDYMPHIDSDELPPGLTVFHCAAPDLVLLTMWAADDTAAYGWSRSPVEMRNALLSSDTEVVAIAVNGTCELPFLWLTSAAKEFAKSGRRLVVATGCDATFIRLIDDWRIGRPGSFHRSAPQ